MKNLINHHVHTTGSDGKLSPEDTIKLAIEKKLSFICFTDHYPCPEGFDEWFLDFHSEEYYKKVLKLKEEFKDKIDISFGAEINWIMNYEEWIKTEIKKREYDYILGAVHHLGKYNLAINSSEEKWNRLIKEFGSVQELNKEYYYQIRLMVESGIFDCVAHFDLVKVWNKNSKYFSEDEEEYKKQVLEVLNKIKKSGICVEINTSGERKSGENHPSFWILEQANKMDIPITIGSDSHSPEQIDYGLEKAIELAKKAGYKSILKFKNRKAIEIRI